MVMDMQQSTLIQRLKTPGLRSWFGASGEKGYFNEDGWDIVSPLFSFDYMGAAEFERERTPEMFMQIGKWYEQGKIVTGQIDMGTSVDYLCLDEHEEEVVKRITLLGDYGDFDEHVWRLKEGTHFKQALLARTDHIKGDWAMDYKGWFELNNGYMFFVDHETFEKTDAMFRSFY